MTSSERNARSLQRRASRPDAEVASNATLLAAAALGDQGAWCELVRRYDATVRSAARRVGLNHADVADVAQSTWLRLLDNVGHIRDPERLGGWLRTTSHNEAVTLAIRDNRRQRGEIRCVDRTEERWNEHPETTVVAGEQRKELDAALHSLSPQRRQIVRLLADGASYVEVCERTGLPQGSIGPTWGRSIRRLRQTPEALRLLAERSSSLLADRSNSLLADRSYSPLAERSGRADGSAA